MKGILFLCAFMLILIYVRVGKVRDKDKTLKTHDVIKSTRSENRTLYVVHQNY